MYGIDLEEDTIHLTRGDKLEFSFYYPILNIDDDTISNYVFQKGDKVTFVVKQKKGYADIEKEVFRKTFIISEETPYPLITLSGEETKWGEVKNKKTVYWYDIVLNDEITILGFDENGAKKIYLYPESREGENYE